MSLVPSNDQILASAVRFLIDGQEELAARMLLACSLKITYMGSWGLDIQGESFGLHSHFRVLLRGPRIAYDVFRNIEHPITKLVHASLVAVLPNVAIRDGSGGNIIDETDYPVYIESFSAAAQIVGIDPNWREDLLEIARGQGISNQASFNVSGREPLTWHNLKFRSASEIKIAEALDRAGALFLPNCMARINAGRNRRNLEPDFLVCWEGKWGILEVDGEPFHEATRAAQDHERDRPFKVHGIRLVEHYDATRCYQDPDGVVKQFLDMLKRV